VQLDRLQRRNDAPTNAPRAQTASAAAASGAAAVGGALTPTLPALLRGRDEPTSLAANVAHAARGNADVANAAAVKPVAMPLAALDPNVHKDAPVARDDGDTMVRVDAVQARSGGADALRDAAPVRLGDLAQQHAQRFAGELADRVLVMRNQRLDGATVTLEPRDLGRIDIQVRLQADTTHVAFTTQHAAVRDALEGQLPRLRSMLEEAGLSLGAVDVAHAGARNATGGDAGSARSHEAPRAAPTADADTADAPAAWRPRASTSLIDLHA
jgi:flagellar hook-length control protein FliK